MKGETVLVILAFIASAILLPDEAAGATVIVAGGGPIVVSPSGVVAIGATAKSTLLKTSTDQIPSRSRIAFLLGQEAA